MKFHLNELIGSRGVSRLLNLRAMLQRQEQRMMRRKLTAEITPHTPILRSTYVQNH